MTVKNPGGLTASGPVNSEYGFPSWYADSNGVRLEPCLAGDKPTVRIPARPALPPVTPAPDPGPITDNTPDTPDIVVPAPVATIAPVSPAIRGATVTLDGSGSSNATGCAWTQVGGPTATLTNANSAKPTVTVPYFTANTATAPAAVAVAVAVPADRDQLQGCCLDPVAFEIPVQADTLTVTANRRKVGAEHRVEGTSLIGGAAGVRTPATSVIVWNMTNPAAPVKLGTAPVDTLGGWSLKLKPRPTQLVTTVLIQSTRGGTATTPRTAK